LLDSGAMEVRTPLRRRLRTFARRAAPVPRSRPPRRKSLPARVRVRYSTGVGDKQSGCGGLSASGSMWAADNTKERSERAIIYCETYP
jgi:hypothetical protein